MLAPNVVLQGRYRIIRQLGKGGMGAVYEALNEPVSSIVALKETFAETEFERQAFIREAKLLANLDHEAFPKVIDHFFEGDGQYLVMEFVRGNDFSELLSLRERPFELEKILEWADQLLDALEELHTHPVIHRDIKPSNLKLTRRGKIKLLDFGIAKGTLERMTKPKTDGSLGAFTLQYAPIEQTLRASPHWLNVLNIINADETKNSEAKSTDPRSDLYSLGATLYHLLTNQTPTDAPTRAVAVWSGKLDPLIPANKLNSQVSPELADVLSQTMSLDRDERPASAAQLRYLLREVVNNPDFVPTIIKSDAASVITPIDVSTQLSDKAAELDLVEQRLSTAESQAHIEASQQPEETQKSFPQDATFSNEINHELSAESSYQNFAVEDVRREREIENSESESGVQATEKSEIELPRSIENSIEPAVFRSRSPILETYPLLKNNWSRRRLRIGVAAIVLGLVAGLSTWQTVDFGRPQMVEGSVNDVAPIVSSTSKSVDTAGSGSSLKTNETEKSMSLFTPRRMALISAGTFMMGQAKNGDIAEHPAHKVTVKPFYMDVYEVTNADYAAFLKTAGQQFSLSSNLSAKINEASQSNYPVTGINWVEADQYCRYHGKRLPTEEEWEFAARGNDQRLYPWGNQWQKGMANANRINKSLTEVGKSRGASPFGIYDMAGNAWEWTASVMKPYPGGKMPPNQPSGKLRVIRGGTYDSSKRYATATYRTGWAETGAPTYNQTGFRCVQDVTN